MTSDFEGFSIPDVIHYTITPGYRGGGTVISLNRCQIDIGKKF